MGEYWRDWIGGIPTTNNPTENNKLNKSLNPPIHDIIYKGFTMTHTQLEAYRLSLVRWYAYGSMLYKYNPRKDELQWVDERNNEAMTKLMPKRNPANNLLKAS